jgi:hypothetical protein
MKIGDKVLIIRKATWMPDSAETGIHTINGFNEHFHAWKLENQFYCYREGIECFPVCALIYVLWAKEISNNV